MAADAPRRPLARLAGALGVPLAGIFIGSEPDLTGPTGAGPIAVIGGKREMPEPPAVIAAIDRVGR